MESLKAVDCVRIKQHQTLYKAKTPPWKDAFREKCIQRLRSNRSRLVDKFRGLELENERMIDVVMKEEWESFTNEQNNIPGLFPSNSQNAVDSQDEYISILEEIQKELIEEERRILEYYAEIEAESINTTIELLERNEVICVFCKKNPLHQNLSIIFCRCGFRIDTQQDAYTLDNFKEQLFDGLNTHEKTCTSSPGFSMLKMCEIENLAITCEVCNYMYLVV